MDKTAIKSVDKPLDFFFFFPAVHQNVQIIIMFVIIGIVTVVTGCLEYAYVGLLVLFNNVW